MGQKIHPIGFRLGITQNHFSIWYAKPELYSFFVLEDYFLRETILKKFSNSGIVFIKIVRILGDVEITIYCETLAPFIGHKTQDFSAKKHSIRKLLSIDLQNFRKKYTNNFLVFQSKQMKALTDLFLLKPPSKTNVRFLTLKRVPDPYSKATCVAQFIASELETRVPFRKAIKLILKHVKEESTNVLGIKIQVSGRLNGAEIARSEWVREGRVPLQTLQASIDYSSYQAQTIYGVIGIKIWIFEKKKYYY
jgi:small subunit ribosomal protein S3